MKVSNNLFNLIKSLSKAEKRYFKLYASRHVLKGKNIFLNVFDAIDRLESYDEEAIKKQFKGEKFVKQLWVTKHYLQKLILRSLSEFHYNANYKTTLYENLKTIKILYDKSQRDLCFEYIINTKKLAYLFNDYNTLLEIFFWGKKLFILKGYKGGKKQLQELFEEEKRVVEKKERINLLWKYSSGFFMTYKKAGQVRSPKDITVLTKIINHPIFNLDEKELDFESKGYYFNTKAEYYLFAGNLHLSRQYREKVINLLEDNPHYIKEDPLRYVNMLNNLLNIEKLLSDEKSIQASLKKLTDIVSGKKLLKTVSENIMATGIFYVQQMDYYIRNEQYEQSVNLIPDISSWLIKNKHSISPIQKLMLELMIAHSYFGKRMYGESLSWLNLIINNEKLGMRQDLFSFAKILNLIIHYELKNLTHLEHVAQSTYNYFNRKGYLYKYEKIVISFLKKAINENSTRALKQAFKIFSKKLEEISGEIYEKNAFGLDYILKWVKQKLTSF